MFHLTEEEVENTVSQFAIPSKQYLRGYLPYAFTEHGLLMLANVLKSEQAIAMSIWIIEIFVKLRETILMNKGVLLKLEQLEHKVVRQGGDIKLIFMDLKEAVEPKGRNLTQDRVQTKRRRLIKHCWTCPLLILLPNPYLPTVNGAIHRRLLYARSNERS